jgi:Immunity protein 53
VEVLERIQAWQKAQLERGRDLSLGVRIETLRERPGWSVQIDLSGTQLSGLKLSPYREGATERDWLAYRIKDDRFEGIGDPTKLQALLFAFLDLADRTAADLARQREKK